ncbi:MAG: MBL fold metallo-hydrolase [Candidatus Electrothrix sp. AR4]|nr:MBL fold metallo-hydrolase [Candidatus Electrothrix sp. AR4]
MRIALQIVNLGQTGFRFEFEGTVIFIDLYLSNSVQEKESEDLVRMQAIPIQPAEVTDADWVLLTHEHRDHCDIETLLPISIASKGCRFLGPPDVVRTLKEAGIDQERILTAEFGVAQPLSEDWIVHPIPSAHPELDRDAKGRFRCLGYVMQSGNQTIYHAGDTSVDQEIINAVKRIGEIDIAFLPVNERNWFLDRCGIIGNMSIREAFQFAEEIGARTLVPTHWDMFQVNSVFREEIEFLHTKLSSKFTLSFDPDISF